MRFTSPWTLLPIVTSGLACGATAAPSVETLPAPGGFVTACGGISGTTGAADPGSDLEAFYLGPHSCTSASFVSGTASASDGYIDGQLANAAQGTVSFGAMQLAAQSVSPNNAAFPYGSANAGWEDTWNIDSALYDGQTGTVNVSLHVHGSWAITGFAGAARITLRPYVNDEHIVVAGTTQGAQFSSSFFPAGVNQTVQFALPMVFGQPFDVGMFALLRAGLRSVSGVEGLSTADADFTHTINWQGIDGVFAGGVEVIDYELSTASGTDWRVPVAVIPEPPTWLAWLAGLALLAARTDSRCHADQGRT